MSASKPISIYTFPSSTLILLTLLQLYTHNYSIKNLKWDISLRLAQQMKASWSAHREDTHKYTSLSKSSKLDIYLDIFVQMNRFIVYVVFQKIFIHTRKECHFWQGKYIHELLHCISLWALQWWEEKERKNKGISRISSFVQYKHFSLVTDTQLLPSLFTWLKTVFQLRPSIKLSPTKVLWLIIQINPNHYS